MPFIKYVEHKFRASSRLIVDQANDIIEEYQADGFELTLRQLYYQFVARDMIPNTMRSYKRLGSIISDARLAGLVNWDAIKDLTRNLKGTTTWENPSGVIHSALYSYAIDLWQGQDTHLEVWVEKEALAGVVNRACSKLRVDYFACKGYTSQSAQWRAAQRLIMEKVEGKKRLVVIHLGDHDPSGIDMTRDIQDRFTTFGTHVDVVRIALNMDQIEKYSPPPNPTKLSDSRANGYIREYGDDSWELDALDPKVIVKMIEEKIMQYLDMKKFRKLQRRETNEKAQLSDVANNWDAVTEFVEGME